MKTILCPVCSASMHFSLARSRKAKRPKTFLTVACPSDGRHFRGFIADSDFVSTVVGDLERLQG